MNNRSDILAELQEISSLLHDAKLAEQKPDVPAGYFDALDDEILSQVQEPSLHILSGLDKNKTIGIPATYFENLSDAVMKKIHLQDEEIAQGIMIAKKRNSGIVYFRRLAIAASLIGIVFIGIKVFQKNTVTVNGCEDGFACLTRDEIREYVNNNIDEFEPEQIHEAFSSGIETAVLENTAMPVEEAASTTIQEEQIEKYIEENPATIDFEDASTDIF